MRELLSCQTVPSFRELQEWWAVPTLQETNGEGGMRELLSLFFDRFHRFGSYKNGGQCPPYKRLDSCLVKPL